MVGISSSSGSAVVAFDFRFFVAEFAAWSTIATTCSCPFTPSAPSASSVGAFDLRFLADVWPAPAFASSSPPPRAESALAVTLRRLLLLVDDVLAWTE